MTEWKRKQIIKKSRPACLLALLMTLVFAVISVPVTVRAGESYGNNCGTGIYASIDTQRENLLITCDPGVDGFTGVMKNYGVIAPPWYMDADSIQTATLQSGIVSIGDCTFEAMPGLHTLKLPGTLESIGDNLLKDTNGVTYIGFSGTKYQWAKLEANNKNKKGAEKIFGAEEIVCYDLGECDARLYPSTSYNAGLGLDNPKVFWRSMQVAAEAGQINCWVGMQGYEYYDVDKDGTDDVVNKLDGIVRMCDTASPSDYFILLHEKAVDLMAARAETYYGRIYFHFDGIAAEGFRFDKEEAEITTISRVQLNPVFIPGNTFPKDYVLTSSNPKIATVEQETGIVYGRTCGYATITGLLRNGSFSAQCLVHVLFYDVLHTNVSAGAFKSIYWAVDNGIANGFDGGTHFNPEDSCTRQQFTIFLWRLAGKPDVKQEEIDALSFTDKDQLSSGGKKAVAWAVREGIIKGKSDGSFGADDPVTREQIAIMLYRAAGKPAVSNIQLNGITKYADYNDFSEGGKTAAAWANANGVITGLSDGSNRFGVKDPCTRAQMAVILYRIDDKDLLAKG